MPYTSQYGQLAFPKLKIIDLLTGVVQTIDLGSFPSRYHAIGTPVKHSRRRPQNLKELSSLTSYGGHEEDVLYYAPTSFTVDAGRYLYAYEDQNSTAYAPVGSPGAPPDPDWSTKLHLQVKDQKVNLANALAEYRQTQNMFVSNAKTITDAFRQLRRGNLSQVFKTLGVKPKQLRGTLANRWLELRYGWLPLISDLHGSVEELQSAIIDRPWFRKISFGMANENQVSRPGQQLPNGTKTHSDDSYKVSYRVVAYVKGSPPATTRLGFTSPQSVLWEITPYSFVADWFIPIGDWLNAMDASVGIQDIYGTVTRKEKIVSTNSLGAFYHRRTYSRTVFHGMPTLPLPTYKPSLGVTRIANACALLSQVFKADNSSATPRKRDANKGKWDQYSRKVVWTGPTRRRQGV